MPEIDLQNMLWCNIGSITFSPDTNWYTMSTTTAVPLLLSSSGISGHTRFRMTVLGMAILFLFQIASTYLGIYTLLYGTYPARRADETIRIFEILAYRETHAQIILWLS